MLAHQLNEATNLRVNDDEKWKFIHKIIRNTFASACSLAVIAVVVKKFCRRCVYLSKKTIYK